LQPTNRTACDIIQCLIVNTHELN